MGGWPTVIVFVGVPFLMGLVAFFAFHLCTKKEEGGGTEPPPDGFAQVSRESTVGEEPEATAGGGGGTDLDEPAPENMEPTKMSDLPPDVHLNADSLM